MGGNKKGNFRLYSNLLTTFLIGGLWHGAGWTFILWGLMHGIAIIVHRLWSIVGVTLNKYVAWLLTFNFINFSWVFFRAENLEDAIKIIKGMLGLSGVVLPNFLKNLIDLFWDEGIKFGDVYSNFNNDSEISLWILIALIVCLLFKNSNQIIDTISISNKKAVLIVFMLSVSLMHFNKNIDFIYFNF